MVDQISKQYISVLSEARASGLLHHAYLLVGSLQSSKKQIAENFLQTLPAYDRMHCTLEDKENKEETRTTISIDQIREVIHSLTRIAEEGKYRVIWIDPAEALTKEAANALLKVLEEPPAHTLFLLFSQSVRSVLPTIASRCHILRFPLPTRKELSSSFDQMRSTDIYAKMEPLILEDSFEKLIGFSRVSVDDFDGIEYTLEHYIHNSNNQNQYAHALRSYLGLRECKSAYKNHVTKTGCVDLMHL
ncbi:hypothetical protein HY621_00490 [Candidatus Uhrbacteria bacterium]|nr:hypothetical protein [Candidatus Uhrbacteria bacterium]